MIANTRPQAGRGERVARHLKKYGALYIMLLLPLTTLIIFKYVPMYGVQIAFRNYRITRSIESSPWVGFKYFKKFFDYYDFWPIVRNTLVVNFYSLLTFPLSLLLALLLNHLPFRRYGKLVQNISYMPHFISTVVVCGLISDFSAVNGVFNDVAAALGGARVSLLTKPGLFTPIYVLSNIWSGMGYGSIIYLAAIGGINSELYEAAMLDGAGRLRQTWHVTLPGLAPTIITMLIMRVGSILNVGYDKILLLMNDSNREAAEVISTFVYQKGLVEASYGYSTAVGLFNSVVCLIFLAGANALSRKFSETSLW